MLYTKEALEKMETIEVSEIGNELKVNNKNLKVWYVPQKNRADHRDYFIDENYNGSWLRKFYWFKYD